VTNFWLLEAIRTGVMILSAWSPYTWDGPFLYLVGGSSTVLVLELAAMNG